MTQILVNDFNYDGNTFTKNESIFQFSTNVTFGVPFDKETMLEMEKSSESKVETPVTGNIPIGFIFPQEYKIQEYCRKHGPKAQNYFKEKIGKMMNKRDNTKLNIRGINDVYCKILNVTDDSKDSIFKDLIVEVSKNSEKYMGSVIHQLRKKMVVNELEILPYPDYEPDLIDLVHEFEELTDDSKLAKMFKDGSLKDYIEKINCKIGVKVMTDPVRFPKSCYPGAVDNSKQQEYVIDRSTAENITNKQHPESGEPFEMDQLEQADDIKDLIDLLSFYDYI